MKVKPRASSSAAVSRNRPIAFDEAQCRHIAQSLKKALGAKLAPDERLGVHGELAQSHALVGCELRSADDSAATRLQVCVELEPNHFDGPIPARDCALDVLQQLLLSYFESERLLFLPPVWQPHDAEGHTVLFRGERYSPKLDAEADRLLADAGFDAHGEPIESTER